MAKLTTFDWYWMKQAEGMVLVNFTVRRTVLKGPVAKSISTTSPGPTLVESNEAVHFFVRVPFDGKVENAGFPPEEVRKSALERAHDFVLDLPAADLF